jgi:hypothetical protein
MFGALRAPYENYWRKAKLIRKSYMKGVLLRVGCDSTLKGGNWNAPVDLRSLEYVYVPIWGQEDNHRHLGDCPTYGSFSSALQRLGVSLPPHLPLDKKVHLDPDFSSLTIGEPYLQEKGKLSSRGRILNQLNMGDFIAFFAGFRPVGHTRSSQIIDCLFGILHIQSKKFVGDLPVDKRQLCAHGRRKGAEADKDLVILGDPKTSGRFRKAVPIGGYRDGAHRVEKKLLRDWGDLNVNDGYIQRSVRPPFFLDPTRFLHWLNLQEGTSPLLQSNW